MNRPAAYKIKVAPADHADWSGDARDRVYRGVVEEVGPGILEEDPESTERYRATLVKGNMVYYTGGIKIGEAVFIETTDIIAFEELS